MASQSGVVDETLPRLPIWIGGSDPLRFGRKPCRFDKGWGVVRKLGNKSLFPIGPEFWANKRGLPMISTFTQMEISGMRRHLPEHVAAEDFTPIKYPIVTQFEIISIVLNHVSTN